VGWENTKKDTDSRPAAAARCKEMGGKKEEKEKRSGLLESKQKQMTEKLCSGFRMQSEVEYHRVEIKSWKTPH
jgi:hypothetical protein